MTATTTATAATTASGASAPAGGRGRVWRALRPGSGARVGDLYRRLLAVIFAIAWLSLGAQVRLLIGARGLMPLRDFVEAARDQSPGLSFADFPTIFLWAQGDGALIAGVLAGVALAVVAFIGVRPRLCVAVSTALYLSYAVACRTFLSFQWDNLLLECGMLAIFLPAGRAAPLTHLLFRLVLFKLYFESGIAKWQSPLHDWHDGSAMASYYETAPLPTWIAWYAHDLPLAWHRFESRAVLALELIGPLAIFGTRRLRLAVAALFTIFQLVNIATANYGFFCYLALALHVFLLDDGDVDRAARRAARLMPSRLRQALAARAKRPTDVLTPGAPPPPSASSPWRKSDRAEMGAAGPAARREEGEYSPYLTDEQRSRRAGSARFGDGRLSPRAARAGAGLAEAAAGAATLLYVFVSVVQALFHFTEPGPGLARLAPVLRWGQTLRVVNTYHLFAAITRERVEPELQLSTDGGRSWVAHHLWHKPGDPARAPDFVAPHQPRVDFQLWFYGLAYEHREPSYVATLVGRLCEDPAAVQSLFRTPLPVAPDAVRIAYWRYRFTSRADARATGAWWRREWVGATRAIPCHR